MIVLVQLLEFSPLSCYEQKDKQFDELRRDWAELFQTAWTIESTRLLLGLEKSKEVDWIEKYRAESLIEGFGDVIAQEYWTMAL